MPKLLKKRPNYIMGIGIVIVLGVLLWNVHSYWQISQIKTTTVKQGWVRHEKKLKAVFANTETILTAPMEGTVIPMLEEGQRFRKGETVARIIPTGVGTRGNLKEVAITAPISGLFYRQSDGLEDVITPENLVNMDLAALLNQAVKAEGSASTSTQGSQTQSSPDTTSTGMNDEVGKNSPLGKMVNNLYPSWMFVYLDESDVMIKGDTVKFIIDDEEYVGTVIKISGKPKGAVIRYTQYINGTTESRVKEVIWSYKPSTKGVLVPASSLCTFGEERGVYVGVEGVIRFMNIKVLDSNGTLACVEGIPEGIQVIQNPQKGIEGLTIDKI